MIELRHFTQADCDVLAQDFYAGEPALHIAQTITEWNTCEYQGRYFEMFAVCADGEVVGSVSLYAHPEGVISAGPTILERYQRQGYGSAAVKAALDFAAEQGYVKAAAQVREDNTASLALHRRLGFSLAGKGVSRKGNAVHLFEMQL